MWNHSTNCSTSGDDDSSTSETDPSLWLKQRIERSLDLSQYLKYLDELFSQPSSDSESSDSEDGESNHTFTEFRHPPAAVQAQERPQFAQAQNSLFLGTSSDYSNHVSSFGALKSADGFQVESNISSSSLSSIDSGTSSLNLSSESYLDVSHGQAENGVAKSSESSRTDEENDGTKEKKSQKKKKTGRNSTESISRQHKPSSGGTGNNGGGGGTGSSASGGSSSDNSGGSSGSSSNQSLSGSSGSSPGAKSRSGQPSFEQSNAVQDDIITATDITSKYANNNNNNVDCNESANTDLQRALGIRDSSIRSLFLQGDMVDNFETDEDSFSSSFPLLDNIPDEEASLSDFISMSTTLPSTNGSPSSTSQCSTNFFSKIAEAAAASSINYSSRNNTNGSGIKDKDGTKKRKLEAKANTQPCKISKLTEKQKQSRIEYLNAKRRKIYVYISRKEVMKAQRTQAATFKESLAIKRKLAQACARQVQKNALQSQKCMKESVCKAKRLTQEMEAYWKSVEKSERELQRKVEKDARDKMKKDAHILNKFKAKKLAYLITQIELFVNKLLNKNIIEVNEDDLIKNFEIGKEEDERIKYKINSEILKSSIHSTIDRAVNEHHSLVRLLDMSGAFIPNKNKGINLTENTFCKLAEGNLKPYQVFGVNWIKNLYKKGLNGILADESGLGKKAQVTGFLSLLAESYSLWGPFLIVAPLNSVCRWQQELSRMCSKFRVIPYFGKPVERKNLRQGWEKSGVHTEDAGFHVVLTSYQVMASDLKYFSKTKWQYLVMDDPQSIITSSSKWMALLSFRCRNKLLLCGNLRLNSLPHLCSYLYFIMPSLFDSQKELSEWLLTELESPNNTNISVEKEEDFKILGRLKAVVQNFSLCRKMNDVELSATHGIDIQLKCTLTERQRQLYYDVLEKSELRSILVNTEKCSPEEIRARMKAALNLSLQLRKVCNHPELLDESVYWSPHFMKTPLVPLPSIVGTLPNALDPKTHRVLGSLFCIFSAINIHNSLFGKTCTKGFGNTTWSFTRLLNLSCNEVEKLFTGGIAMRLNHLVNCLSVLERIQCNQVLTNNMHSVSANFPAELLFHTLRTSKLLSALILTSNLCWRKYAHWPCWNSIEYRTLKTRKYFRANNKIYPQAVSLANSEVSAHIANLEYPNVLQCYSCAVYSEGYKPYISNETVNRNMLIMEKRIAVSEFLNEMDLNKSLDREFAAKITESILSLPLCHRFLKEHEPVIGASGKIIVLDKLLSTLKVQNHQVLLVTHLKETLPLLEDYLKLRRWKYIRVEDDMNNTQLVQANVFVYLMFAHCSKNIKTPLDSIVFFDHDWGTELEHQKAQLLSKLGGSTSMDCFGIVCRRTIEERMVSLTKERNIVSLTLVKDVFGNKPVSSIPALKSLVSILMHELYQKRVRVNEPSSMMQNTQSHDCSEVGVTVKENVDLQAICTHKHIPENYSFNKRDGTIRFKYANDMEGSESSSPSCSEDPEIYMDDEDGQNKDALECNDRDNFSLSFDEGYMGMSPDSFECVTIKSDYEEHSLPEKPKIGRGCGKRGRPPRVHRVNLCNDGLDTTRRGPGRPRLKTVGPSNQGARGRKPGRPPLAKKAETISSGLASLSSGQNVFGFYNSSDLELS